MNTRFKLFASYNILQYLCDLIHVLIFVTVSKCQFNEYSDKCMVTYCESPRLSFQNQNQNWDARGKIIDLVQPLAHILLGLAANPIAKSYGWKQYLEKMA
jgi:hypothetical protein